MNPTLNEIAEIVTKAKIFAASIPEGDIRLHLIPHTNALCAAIDLLIHALESSLPFSELMRSEYEGRLALSCEQLRGLLVQAKALDLAQEIGRANKKLSTQRNEASLKGIAKRKEQAFDKEAYRKDADDLIAKHPKWSNLTLANHLCKKYNRTPDYLSRFIPKRK